MGGWSALDIETGKPVWEARVSYPQDGYIDHDGSAGSPRGR